MPDNWWRQQNQQALQDFAKRASGQQHRAFVDRGKQNAENLRRLQENAQRSAQYGRSGTGGGKSPWWILVPFAIFVIILVIGFISFLIDFYS